MTTATVSPPTTAAGPDRARPGWQTAAKVLAAVLVLLLLGALPYLVGPYGQQVGYRAMQLGAMAVAWNLLAGYGGLVSLGSAAFVGSGAYAATEIGNQASVPVPLLLVLGAAMAALLALVISPAMFRLRGLYFTVGTLALAAALQILVINLKTLGGASGRIVKTPAPADYVLYWYALGVGLLATAVVATLLALPTSLSLRAVRDDEDVARDMGVRTFRTKLWAFMLSSALMGMVGALQAIKLGAIEPYGAFGLNWTIDIVSAAVIGGLGTKAGPWVGAVFYVLLAERLRDYPEWHVAITGALVLLVIRFAPWGIWGTYARKSRARSLTRHSTRQEPTDA